MPYQPLVTHYCKKFHEAALGACLLTGMLLSIRITSLCCYRLKQWQAHVTWRFGLL